MIVYRVMFRKKGDRRAEQEAQRFATSQYGVQAQQMAKRLRLKLMEDDPGALGTRARVVEEDDGVELTPELYKKLEDGGFLKHLRASTGRLKGTVKRVKDYLQARPGVNFSQAGKALGLTRAYVGQIAKSLGIERRPKRASKKTMKIIEAWDADPKASVGSMAKRFGVSRTYARSLRPDKRGEILPPVEDEAVPVEGETLAPPPAVDATETVG